MERRWLLALLTSLPLIGQQNRLQPIADTWHIGGHWRTQYHYIGNEDWGDAPKDRNGFLLIRLLAHADWQTKRTRLFLQTQTSIAMSRKKPNVVDQNPLELHQAYLEFDWLENSNLKFRIGRQEMQYGAQRLIAARDFPNSRLSFDGVRLMYSGRNFKSDAFYTQPVVNHKHVFDDAFLADAGKLWGSYNTLAKVPWLSNIDCYFLGFYRRSAHQGNLQASESRYTVGTRIWKNIGHWQYDFEAAYQWGSFADLPIRAWTVSSNTAYLTGSVFFTKAGVKASYVSGDKKTNNGRLQTFHAMYPRGAFFGFAGLIGPANLIDLHPYTEWQLHPNLLLMADYTWFWRASTGNGIYAPNMQPIYNTNDGAKFIGSQATIALSYKYGVHWSNKIELLHFDAGPYLKTAGNGKDVCYALLTTQLQF